MGFMIVGFMNTHLHESLVVGGYRACVRPHFREEIAGLRFRERTQANETSSATPERTDHNAKSVCPHLGRAHECHHDSEVVKSLPTGASKRTLPSAFRSTRGTRSRR